MGKSLPSASKLHEFAKMTSHNLKTSKTQNPISENRFFKPETSKSKAIISDSEKLKLKMENPEIQNQFPLKEVVSDCVKRWFRDTLKEAKAGDIAMQVLVGQMYNSGYGVPKDTQKGKAWITRAAKNRSSVWKVGNKRPGYNASDSDSDSDSDESKDHVDEIK